MSLPADFKYTGPCVIESNGIEHRIEGPRPLLIAKNVSGAVPVEGKRLSQGVKAYVTFDGEHISVSSFADQVCVGKMAIRTGGHEVFSGDTPVKLTVCGNQFLVVGNKPKRVNFNDNLQIREITSNDGGDDGASGGAGGASGGDGGASGGDGGVSVVDGAASGGDGGVSVVDGGASVVDGGASGGAGGASGDDVDDDMVGAGYWGKLMMTTTLNGQRTEEVKYLTADSYTIGRSDGTTRHIFDLKGNMRKGYVLDNDVVVTDAFAAFSRNTVTLSKIEKSSMTFLKVDARNGVEVDGDHLETKTTQKIDQTVEVVFPRGTLKDAAVDKTIPRYSIRVERIDAPKECSNTLAVDFEGGGGLTQDIAWGPPAKRARNGNA